MPVNDTFSDSQGVEDDMNIICLCGNVTGYSVTLELVRIFLNADFKGTEWYLRHL
jgi:ribose 5-phosphate isomerase B